MRARERSADRTPFAFDAESLTAIQEAAQWGMWELDYETGRLSWTPNVEALFGLAPGSFGGRIEDFYQYVLPEDRPALERSANAALSSPEPAALEFRIRRPSGNIRWIASRNVTIRDAGGRALKRIGICLDVTVPKGTEMRLWESEEKLRIALQATDLLVFHQDDRLRYTWIANPKLGVMEEDILGKTDEEIMGVEAAAPLLDIKRRVLQTGNPEKAVLHVALDGQSGWFELTVQPRRDPAGAVIGILCAGRDITARKESDEERRQYLARVEGIVDERTAELGHEKERLELTLRASNLGTWDSDRRTGKVEYDERCCAIIGFTPADLPPILDAWLERVHPDDKAATLAAIRAHERGETSHYRFEYRLRHKDGHWVWVAVLGKIVARDEAGNPWRLVGTIRDITAEKRLDMQGNDLLKRIEGLMRDVMHSSAPPAAPADADTLDHLPRRQRQILVMIAEGLNSNEIAERLGIGRSSVVTHRRALMKRLNVHGTAELVRVAMQHRLVHG